MTPDEQTRTHNDGPGAGRAWVLLCLVALFLMLASLYNVSVPLYESPDELQHAAFAAHLAQGQGLPVVDPGEPGPWEQEGTQPPLYYWLVARLVGWLPHTAVDELAHPPDGLAELNPYAGIGDPQRPDNKNRVLHGTGQEQGVLFVHLARAISTLMAAGTLLAVYRLGRILFPSRVGVAWGMVALVAFIPQFLFLSASINNDNLVILIAAWTLVLLAGWLPTVRRPAPRLPGWLSLAGLGLLLGLAALAKFSGVLLWPLAGGVLLWLAWRERNLRWLFLAGLLVFGLALALSGWWFVRNYSLYGDLSALGPHLAIMGTRRRPPSWAQAGREFNGFRYSFWALFGWFNILAPEPFYWFMDGLVILGAVGLILFVVRSWRRLAPSARGGLVLLAAWLGLVLAGLVRWTLMTPASQGRLLYPALPAIALFLVVGWAALLRLVPVRWHRPVGIIALVGWLLWAALCAILFIRPAYALPDRLASVTDLAAEPSALQVRYGDCCELLAYESPAEPVYAGEWVPLRLVWRVLEETEQNYALYVHATTVGGQVAGQLDTYHGGGMYPTGQWHAGEIIDDVVWVPISWRAEGPALLRFQVGLHEPGSTVRLPGYAPGGEVVDVVFAGEAALLPFDWPALEPGAQMVAAFEEEIELAAIDLPQEPVHAGQAVTVTLHWQALAPVAGDYTGFVHLVAPDGGDVTQDDHLPLAGKFPTRLWVPGAVIADPYRLDLPADLPAGTYELYGGFYQAETGVRLQALSPTTGERWQDDLVYLGTLVID